MMLGAILAINQYCELMKTWRMRLMYNLPMRQLCINDMLSLTLLTNNHGN